MAGDFGDRDFKTLGDRRVMAPHHYWMVEQNYSNGLSSMIWFRALQKYDRLAFRGAIGLLFLIALGLRFWGLSRFNVLVFDETYYANFAEEYLTLTPCLDACDGHPPLSKYIIAAGMWLGLRLPFGQDTVNTLTGSALTTFSYRWINALTGSFVPLVIAGLAYQLSHRRSHALIAGLFAAIEGLLLVESRYALNNIYLLLFGLLGQWGLLLALNGQNRQRTGWLLFSGINFGLSVAIKWNGLWFLFGAYSIWVIAWGIQWLVPSWHERDWGRSLPVQRFTQLRLWEWAFFLGVVPVLAYSLTWIPHLMLNPEPGFLAVHQWILSYHQNVGGNDPSVHPYCSAWYTWPMMIRPVVYLYETVRSVAEVVPIRPRIPLAEAKLVYDVRAMGNPVLWWFSTLTIGLFGVALVEQMQSGPHRSASIRSPLGLDPVRPALGVLDGGKLNASRSADLWQTWRTDFWLMAYLLVNYLANLLPWVRVERCTFLYHYMPASSFALVGLAWLCDRWLQDDRPSLRALALTLILLALLAFVFWLPLYLGLPLSPEAAQLRRWLTTW